MVAATRPWSGAGGDGRGLGTRPAAAASREGAAFTLLELEVSLVVLVAGLLGLVGLLAVQARQIGHAEAWCRADPTYYLVSHSNPWMRRLEPSADLSTQPGQVSWTPPVSGTQQYDIHLTAVEQDLEGQVITATCSLDQHGQ